MKAKMGPGSMCWINSACGIPENIGAVVEIIDSQGLDENGATLWHIHSQKPLLCYKEILPGWAVEAYRNCCECSEPHMTLINGDETSTDDEKAKEHDTSDLL